MFLRFAPFNAPKSYVFKDPDTKHNFEAANMKELCHQITNYRSQNDLPPIEYLETVVENYLCSRRENLGGCEPLPKLKRGLFPTIKGGLLMLTNLMYNSFVPQAVADERALQCTTCKFNIFPDRGPFIKWADTIAEHTVGDRRTKYHDKLGNCEVCSCPLRAKCWYNGKISLTTEEILKMKTVSCWQLKEVSK